MEPMITETQSDTLPLFVLHENRVDDDDDDDEEEQTTTTRDTYVLARTANEKASLSIFLNTSKVIERTIKYTNVSYICPEKQWQRKINNYLQQTGNFTFIGDITSNHTQQILTTMSDHVVKTLHQLLHSYAITNEQYDQMMFYNQSRQFEINRLDFIPEIRQNQIVLQPTIQCSSIEPMKGISNVINNILKPIIDRKFYYKTFPTGYEAIKALSNFQHTTFHSKQTLLVTIEIHDLHSTLSHHLMIESLKYFFQYYHYDKTQFYQATTRTTIATTTILKLIELILQNQFCLYDDHQLYRQIYGSSMDSPLITTLINIYLFSWQYDLISQLPPMKDRLFGRNEKQYFFSWNDSKDKLIALLNRRNLKFCKLPDHIPMTVTINNKLIHYLDAQINYIQRNQIQTSVYHHAYLEPYALPYLSIERIKSHYPFLTDEIHLLLFATLIRAILFCSNIAQFEYERFYIELSFLLNDVSSHLIQTILKNFLNAYHLPMMTLDMDEHNYQTMRSQIQMDYEKQRTPFAI